MNPGESCKDQLSAITMSMLSAPAVARLPKPQQTQSRPRTAQPKPTKSSDTPLECLPAFFSASYSPSFPFALHKSPFLALGILDLQVSFRTRHALFGASSRAYASNQYFDFGTSWDAYWTLPLQNRISLPSSHFLSLGQSRCNVRRSISHSILRFTPVYTRR